MCVDYAYPYLPVCLSVDLAPSFNNIAALMSGIAEQKDWHVDQDYFKCAVNHRLGVDTLIRGRDLQGYPFIRKYIDCFVPAPKEYYHPVLVCEDGKVSKSVGAHQELQLGNLLGNNPEMAGMTRNQRSMVLGVYAVAVFSGQMPTKLEDVFIFHQQYDIDKWCQQPDVVYSASDFSACIQLVRESVKE
jgi:hypothetical protein